MKSSPNTDIANTAFDQLQAAKEQVDWLGAFIWSIKDSLKNDRPEHTQTLVGVAGYLASEYSECLGNEINLLDKRLLASNAGN
ncbi:hypothetical protein [uncultured Pseudomonas sp.]|uniref:hypothetical protein n=1 Tax=uncultured Pseudomonas sp. TaxID=114707 RepID=UPI0025E01D38|nr:hypothetical protein [uncultured Pseudomonas sp.]